MLVVDSSVWIDFFNGAVTPARGTLRQLLARGEVQIIVPDLVLYEVLRGFRQERHYLQAQQLLLTLTVEPTGGQRHPGRVQQGCGRGQRNANMTGAKLPRPTPHRAPA